MNALQRNDDEYEAPVITPMVIKRENMTIVAGCFSVDRICNGSSNGCGAKLSNDNLEPSNDSNLT